MKKTLFLLFIIIIFCSPDNPDDMVKITEYGSVRKTDGSGIVSEGNERYIPASTETLVLEYEMGHKVYSIEGVEQLKNLKNLYLGYGLSDVSFLENMESLEIL